MKSRRDRAKRLAMRLPGGTILLAAMLATLLGCGTVKSRSATEQLLISDAVDRSVAQIDFRPLAGKRVFLDTRYVRSIGGVGFVNADYIIGSLRQQMMAANCRLQESVDTADYTVEVRVGALGSDDHEVNYGLPASNAFSMATSLVSTMPAAPMIPEISLAKRNQLQAAAKVAVFAYDRRTQRPVWQSGISQGQSSAKAMWLLGAGPFQSGNIYDGARFAGAPIRVPSLNDSHADEPWSADAYYQTRHFAAPDPLVRLPPTDHSMAQPSIR